ncbi:MAG TPA: methyl-accepting chemotaxis protein [Roseiflexaceae bacterium]|nr:methyl-accepting chemotaxis protein [Roseiflexaceae bacterium]
MYPTHPAQKSLRRQFGLRLQLLVAFGVLSLLVAVVAGTALWGLLGVRDSAHQAVAVDGHLSQLASDVAIETLQSRRYEKDFFMSVADASTRAEYLEKWRASYAALDQAIDEFDKTAIATGTTEDQQQARDWRGQASHYHDDFEQFARAVAEGSIASTQAANDAFSPFKENIRLLTESSVAFADGRASTALAAGHTLEATGDRTIWLVGLLTGIALVVGMVWSVLFAARLLHPVLALQTATSRVAAGDLDTRVKLVRGDEFGQLASSFNRMTDTISTQITEQQRANEELRAASATRVAKEYLEEVVRAYSLFAGEVAQGNLTARLSIDDQQDDLSLLGHNLNNMVESLHRMTSQTRQANAAIAAAAAEILAATTQQAASAAEQSAAITQTTTTIEEVKAIAVQTADRAAQVAQDSQAALSVARQGTGAVEETVSGMSQIRTRVESIATTILALAEQTHSIGTIISTVSELADQSNLLALNAAIEAARAGEAGKSFAVVAQHVRDLAERSKVATSHVKEILGDIQRATNAAVLVTEEGTKGVEVGSQLAAQAGQVIHRIAGEVDSGAQASVQIVAAATQQAAGMEQVGQAMASIQQATTQALASTRQAERAAQDLHALSQSLQQAIAVYRL